MRKFVPEDNILDTFNLTTYNVALYMLRNDDIRSNDRRGRWGPDNGIIIAQSGVTSQIFFEDLTIRSHPSYSRAAKNSNLTDISITLREFSGASLIDKIIAASLELGLENYFQCPYFLQVTFRGNQPTPDGSFPINGNVNNLVYRWPIMITGIETNVVAGGAGYQIKAKMYGEMAQQDEFCMIGKQLEFYQSTVGGALTEVANVMTRRSIEQTTTGLTKPDVYNIIVDPDLAGYRLTDSDDSKSERTASMDEAEVSDPSLRKVVIEKNTRLINFINRILTSSPDYQKAAQDIKSETEDSLLPETNGNLKRMHRVISRTDIGDYDPGRGVYQKTFTFYVVPHLMGQVVANNSDANINSQDRLQQYLENDLMKKRYYYLFTGQNDQVLEFDLNFNFGWYVNMPVQGGLGTNYVHSAEGRKFSGNLIELREKKAQVAQILDKFSTAGTQEFSPQEFSREAERLAAQIREAVLTPEEQEEVKSLIDRSARDRLPTTTPGNQTRTVEEIPISQLAKNTKFRKYPLSFLETSVQKDVGEDSTIQGKEQEKTSGAAYVNSLFNQAFTGPSGDLASIELLIKGDPYWLGRNVGDEPPANTVINNVDFPEPQQAFQGQPAFVFTLRTPELPGVDSGTVKARETAINGVYLANTVEHRFENGKFTQTILATVDPTLNVEDVIGQIGDVGDNLNNG